MVYKISIRDAIVFFETGYFKLGKRKAAKFTIEFDKLFNKAEFESSFNRNIDILRLSNKVDELKAIYYSLIYSNGENAKLRFKEIFGKEFEGNEADIKAINDKALFYISKLNSMPKQKDEKGLSFSDIVAMIESSRAINIDREMKVFEFYKIYELELKRWKTESSGRHK